MCVHECIFVYVRAHALKSSRDADSRPDKVNPSWDLIHDVVTQTGPQEFPVYIE